MSCLGYDMDRSTTPYEVRGGRDFEWMSENDVGVACGRRATGAVICWGTGQGPATERDGGAPQYRMPIERPEWHGAIDVAPTGRHICGILASGRVACAGYNGYGQLGDGTTEMRDLPVAIEGLP